MKKSMQGGKSVAPTNAITALQTYEGDLQGSKRKKAITLRNVRRILRFAETEICVEAAGETIVFRGNGLACRIYADRSLGIEGGIEEIFFDREH